MSTLISFLTASIRSQRNRVKSQKYGSIIKPQITANSGNSGQFDPLHCYEGPKVVSRPAKPEKGDSNDKGHESNIYGGCVDYVHHKILCLWSTNNGRRDRY